MKTKKHTLFYLFTFFICAGLTLAVTLYGLSCRHLKITYLDNSTEESSALLENPYCGFYKLSGYTLSETATSEEAATWCQKSCRKNPYPLMLLEINLKQYANTSLSSTATQQLDSILEQCEKAKKQVILRLLYDWEEKALETEPSDLQLILQHIRQLAPSINTHADCVYILQGLLVGNHGEMHHSNYENINQLRQIATELANATDPQIYLAVRTPGQLRGILGTQTPLESRYASEQSLASRLGLFNDGMLGSVYDLGTYDDTPMTYNGNLEEKGTRSEELLYQYRLCQYVPNGGEVTVDNTYNDLENAITDLARMHVSYLNADHDLQVLNKWKQSTYSGKDVFSGCNGYDYIQAHLGYRYVLRSSHLDFHPLLEDQATLSITIANTGFASSYQTFDSALILTNQTTGHSMREAISLDNCSIAGEDESDFHLTLDVRSLEKGTYTLSLELQDPYTKSYIHFANLGYETSDSIDLGTLTIHE